MKRQLVFIPVSAAELDVLAGAVTFADRTAYAVTDDLLEELGYDATDSEDAEYAALVLASVAGLAANGERLIVVADVPADLVQPGEDSPNGEILLTRLPTTAITAWFADEPGIDIAAAAAACHGMSIDEAWEQPAVQALLRDHDLLHNDVVEFRRGKEG